MKKILLKQKSKEIYSAEFEILENDSAIYKNDIQISKIEFSNVIYNDLHDYTIYIKDDDNIFISILLNYYLYVVEKFKPGVKATKSVVKYYQKDSNKDLISKYNPDWIRFK